MVLYPEVQRRAQKEIDDIVGADRLPEFQGLVPMPYISAILKELLQWQPVALLGQCHIDHEGSDSLTGDIFGDQELGETADDTMRATCFPLVHSLEERLLLPQLRLKSQILHCPRSLYLLGQYTWVPRRLCFLP